MHCPHPKLLGLQKISVVFEKKTAINSNKFNDLLTPITCDTSQNGILLNSSNSSMLILLIKNQQKNSAKEILWSTTFLKI